MNRIIHTLSTSRTALILLLATLLTATAAQTAWADTETVSYIDADGNAQTVTATVLTGTEKSLGSNGQTTWYVVNSNIQYTDVRIYCYGDINLILADGTTMTMNNSDDDIASQSGSLTIYGQALGTGTLDATSSEHYAINYEGNITINGGTVNAKSGCYGLYAHNIAINGGKVTVTVTGNFEGIKATYGTITLGLRSASDFIQANSYNGTVNIKDGQNLADESGNIYSGTLTDGQKEAIAGKTLRPAVLAQYIDADGQSAEHTALILDGTETNLAAGWYYVGNDISYNATLTLDGDVHLILADGCEMKVGESDGRISGYGISGYSYTLDIYAQSLGDDMGALSIYNSGSNKDGIKVNALTVNGGNITADANGSNGRAISATTSNITVNGGNVTANSANSVAIHSGAKIYINGGTVTATGCTHGIGGSSLVEINGGTVNATCTGSGYGIRATGSLAINGGNITASSFYAGTAITLGWTRPADRITASSISTGDGGTVAVKDGQALTDGSGNIYTGTLSADDLAALAGKTLRPAVLAQYIDANGQSAEHTALILDGTETTLAAGWYFVGKDIAYTQTLRLTADATLILADGCTMSINPATPGKGIDGYNDPDEDASLTIYGQTQGSGTLAIATTGVAGPNGWDGTLGHAIHVKDYTQHSGTVTLRTSGAHAEGLTANGNVTINGGTADITAAATASNGINSGGHVTISGGRVTANAADDDYDGILVMGDATLEGGKCVYIPKNVTITGGIVDASSIAAYWGGDITLGWTSPADCITVGNYKLDDGDDASPDGSVKIADGQALCAPGGTIYTGTLGSEQIAAINGRELTPICLLTESDGVSKLAGQANVPVIFTRSGLTANAYSTMCLPFGFEKPNNCTFYAFKGVGWSDANNQWEATISETSTLAAHTPYIFKCSDTEATFIGTIASVPTDIEASLVEVGASEGDDTNWKFKGTYTALDWKSANPSEPTYGFSTYVPVEQGNTENIAAGTFVRFVQGASLAPFRARLIYSGSNEHLNARGHSRAAQAESELPRYIIVRIIGADGTATAIGTLDTTTGQLSTDEWYTLGGRRLEAKPNAKGIYIHNGRKVIVK